MASKWSTSAQQQPDLSSVLGAQVMWGRRQLLRNVGLLSGGVAVLGLVGCSEESSSSNAQSGDGFSGSVATSGFEEVASMAPFIIARELGYFKDANVAPKFTPFAGGSETVQGILSATGIGACGPLSAMIAYSKGQRSLRLIASLANVSTIVFLTKPDSEVSSAADFRGKKVGVSAPGGVTDYLIGAVAQDAGLKVGSDFESVYVGGAADSWTAVTQDIVDVGWSTSPLSTQLVQEGKAKVVAVTKDVVAPWTEVALVATEDFIADNRDGVQGIVDGISKADALINSNPDEAARAYAAGAGIEEALAADILKDLGYESFALELSDEALARIAEAGQELGQIDEGFTPTDMLVKDFVDNAAS